MQRVFDFEVKHTHQFHKFVLSSGNISIFKMLICAVKCDNKNKNEIDSWKF